MTQAGTTRSLLNKALALAMQAHQHQLDKGGHPYLLHPLRVMMQFQDETLQIIAVLHDVIEDSDITPNDLSEQGFTQEMIDAIVALTRQPDETYPEFILRVSLNPLARQVKIADLRDNMDITRLPELTEKDLNRLTRYHHALKALLTPDHP